MQPYSDYEIAQQRIAERQRKKTRFRTLLFFVAIAGLIALIDGQFKLGALPLSVTAGILFIAYGIDRYIATLQGVPNADEVEQEIKWLFKEDWHELTSAQLYVFAQDRIHKRRIWKQRFIRHLLFFVPVNGAIVLWGFTEIAHFRPESNSVYGLFLLLIGFIWLVIFINHARSTFPSKRTLANREIKYGTTLQYELTHLQSAQAKPKEKLKHGNYYQVGDDGELEEVEDDKPKRSSS